MTPIKLSAPLFSSATAEQSAGMKRKLDGAVLAVHLRAGDLCPKCQVERVDYDGLLNLACPQCGTLDGAWGGCS